MLDDDDPYLGPMVFLKMFIAMRPLRETWTLGQNVTRRFRACVSRVWGYESGRHFRE